MENQLNNITLSRTAAKYLLSMAKDLVSRLFGSVYDPSRGVLTGPDEIPSIYERSLDSDPLVQDWINVSSGILRTLAGILYHALGSLSPTEVIDLPPDDDSVGSEFFRSLGIDNDMDPSSGA